ncbi:MAG: GreA/GreB family elongation factor [Candidatus Dojkabacteria bacterium]|jgi:transcription elongation factor GreA|nr:GreA/GreB family elongation factor [Candidatus Dojkabacteria bacterium]
MKTEKYQITIEKKKELIHELKELHEKDLIEVTNRLEESRDNDNDEDDAMLGVIALEKQGIENRIEEISDILDNCELIKDKNYCEPDKISIGSNIKLKEGKKVLDIRLVSSIEADPTKSYISDKSPLGRKLLKAKVGDTVSLKVRGNTISYKVLDVC